MPLTPEQQPIWFALPSSYETLLELAENATTAEPDWLDLLKSYIAANFAEQATQYTSLASDFSVNVDRHLREDPLNVQKTLKIIYAVVMGRSNVPSVSPQNRDYIWDKFLLTSSSPSTAVFYRETLGIVGLFETLIRPSTQLSELLLAIRMDIVREACTQYPGRKTPDLLSLFFRIASQLGYGIPISDLPQENLTARQVEVSAIADHINAMFRQKYGLINIFALLPRYISQSIQLLQKENGSVFSASDITRDCLNGFCGQSLELEKYTLEKIKDGQIKINMAEVNRLLCLKMRRDGFFTPLAKKEENIQSIYYQFVEFLYPSEPQDPVVPEAVTDLEDWHGLPKKLEDRIAIAKSLFFEPRNVVNCLVAFGLKENQLKKLFKGFISPWLKTDFPSPEQSKKYIAQLLVQVILNHKEVLKPLHGIIAKEHHGQADFHIFWDEAIKTDNDQLLIQVKHVFGDQYISEWREKNPSHSQNLFGALKHKTVRVLRWAFNERLFVKKDLSVMNGHGFMPLHYAAAEDNADAIRLLLLRGASPDSLNYDNQVPDQCTKNPEIQKLFRQRRQELLLRQQIAVSEWDEIDQTFARDFLGLKFADDTMIIVATRLHRLDYVRKFMSAGVAVNVKDDEGNTALAIAAAAGQLAIVRELLSKQEHTEAIEEALIPTVMNDQVEIVRCFLEAIYEVELIYYKVAERAIANNKLGIIQLLRSYNPEFFGKYLSHSSDLINLLKQERPRLDVAQLLITEANANSIFDGETALVIAARIGATAIVEQLLAVGATDNDAAALKAAANAGYMTIVTKLIAHISYPVKPLGIEDEDRDAVIFSKLLETNSRCALAFTALERGEPADCTDLPINACNSAGQTLLIKAAAQGDVLLVKTLLERGASTVARCAKFKTAWMYAAEAGHLAVIRELSKAKGFFEQRTQLLNTTTPQSVLAFAVLNKHWDVVRELILLKADIHKPEASLDNGSAFDFMCQDKSDGFEFLIKLGLENLALAKSIFYQWNWDKSLRARLAGSKDGEALLHVLQLPECELPAEIKGATRGRLKAAPMGLSSTSPVLPAPSFAASAPSKVMRTEGDGHCAFHAIFGEDRHGVLFDSKFGYRRKHLSGEVLKTSLSNNPARYHLIQQCILTLIYEEHFRCRPPGGRIGKPYHLKKGIYPQLADLLDRYMQSQTEEPQRRWVFEQTVVRNATLMQFIEDACKDLSATGKPLTFNDKYIHVMNTDAVRPLFEHHLKQDKDINAAYEAYKSVSLADPATVITAEHIQEYANILGGCYYLNEQELALVAEVFELTVVLNYPGTDPITKTPGPKTVVINPGCEKWVSIWHNGRNHFERMVDQTYPSGVYEAKKTGRPSSPALSSSSSSAGIGGQASFFGSMSSSDTVMSPSKGAASTTSSGSSKDAKHSAPSTSKRKRKDSEDDASTEPQGRGANPAGFFDQPSSSDSVLPDASAKRPKSGSQGSDDPPAFEPEVPDIVGEVMDLDTVSCEI